jgi:hypothetical protein
MMEQGRLPGAVRAEQGDALAGLDANPDAGQGTHPVGIVIVEPFDRDRNRPAVPRLARP